MRDGWNYTGDAYLMDDDGYFFYQARTDDMIISAGYNIAGPEVEGALLAHPAVAECGVIGAPDEERGQIVKAFVVLKPGHAPGRAMTQRAAGIRQARDRAVQVSARDRVRRRAAAHRDRQAAALPPAPAGARAKGGGAMSAARGKGSLEMLQPAGWRAPKGYSNGVAGSGRIVFVGGQIGWNALQRFETDDFVGQARQALANVVAVLAAGRRATGAHRAHDVVRDRQARVPVVRQGARASPIARSWAATIRR